MQEVFIDVLALENFVMDYFILYMTSRLLYAGKTARPRRLLLRMAVSAFLGVVYTVCSVLFLQSALSLFLLKGMLSVIMVYVAFSPRTVSGFIRMLCCFYGVTLLSGGAALGVLLLFGGSAAGGTVFRWARPFNYILPVLAVVAVTMDAVAYAAREKKRLARHAVELYIQFEKEGVWMPALVDSGNELRDPYNGKPVVVAELSAVRELLPPGVGAFFEAHRADEILEEPNIRMIDGWESRFRLVPFRSLGCENGILIGFRADLVRIRTEQEETEELHDQIVCLCMRALSGERRYRALLGSGLLVKQQPAVPA